MLRHENLVWSSRRPSRLKSNFCRESVQTAGLEKLAELIVFASCYYRLTVYIKEQSIIEVSACTFDSEGKGEDLGSFQIKYTSKDKDVN